MEKRKREFEIEREKHGIVGALEFTSKITF